MHRPTEPRWCLAITLAAKDKFDATLYRYVHMPNTHGFEVRAFGCSIQVATECPEAHAILERYVLPSLPRMASAADHPDIFIRIVRVVDQFQLLVDDVVVASACEVMSLVTDLVRVLDEAVIERLTTLRAVHAGAVLWKGRALLLPGATHAGS